MFTAINGSTYLRNGAPQCCALCNTPFRIEEGHVECWRGSDHRYYCCREHAEFGLEWLHAALVPVGGKVS
jgi:hypothetical protein